MSKKELNPALIKIPSGFKEMMETYITEVLRFQPEDIPEFSRQYFSALYDNQLSQFLHANHDELNNNMKTLQDYAEVSDRSELHQYNTEDPTEKDIAEMHQQFKQAKPFTAQNEPEPDASAYSMLATPADEGVKRGGSQRVYRNRGDDDDEDDEEEILAMQVRHWLHVVTSVFHYRLKGLIVNLPCSSFIH